jgi:hypothetical protein
MSLLKDFQTGKNIYAVSNIFSKKIKRGEQSNEQQGKETFFEQANTLPFLITYGADRYTKLPGNGFRVLAFFKVHTYHLPAFPGEFIDGRIQLS